jgi:histidine triad (HIT) family protein
MHVVPRHDGDGLGLTWPRQEPPAAVLAGYAERLRAAL